MGRRPLRPAEALQYKPPAPTITRVTKLTAIYLTDGAWNKHIARATSLGYLKPDAWTAKGILNYFLALATPTQQWIDNRPTHLYDLSVQFLDPAHDPKRRKYTERTATYTYNTALPLHHNPNEAPGPRHPIWWDPESDLSPRRKRVFVLSTFPLEYYATLSLTLHIGDPYHRYFQTTLTALASNALEAIGRETLLPTVLISNQHPPGERHLRRHRNKEVSW